MDRTRPLSHIAVAVIGFAIGCRHTAPAATVSSRCVDRSQPRVPNYEVLRLLDAGVQCPPRIAACTTKQRMKVRFVVLMLSLVLADVTAGAPADVRVKVRVDKHTDFSALRTYAWTRGFASLDPELDAFIVAAIDRELASVGL